MLYLAEAARKVSNFLIVYEKAPANAEAFSYGIRQCPTLPGRLQPSTIGAERLNFCVRYGNRWDPFAIVTGMLLGTFRTLKTAHPDFLHLVTDQFLNFPFGLTRISILRLSPRPISISKLHTLPHFHR